MIIRGTLYITTDMNVVMSNLMTSRTIVIGDIQPSVYKQYPQLISGSCILPSYHLASLLLDNRYEEFDRAYSDYLNSDEISSFITAIFKALTVGTNIILYLSLDEAKMRYAEIFMMYLANNRGIIVGTSTSPFNYNSAFDAVNLDYMYLESLITAQDLLLGYPMNTCIMNPSVINKLSLEVNPYLDDRTFSGYERYFNNLLASIKQNNNNILIPAIVQSKHICNCGGHSC